MNFKIEDLDLDPVDDKALLLFLEKAVGQINETVRLSLSRHDDVIWFDTSKFSKESYTALIKLVRALKPRKRFLF